MRRARVIPFAMAVIALCAISGDAEARYHGNINLFAGQKWMTSGDWDPVAEQPELGLQLAFAEERFSVQFAIDAYYAKKKVDNPNPAVDTPVRGTSGEFAIGVRKVWDLGATRPYIAGGACSITVREDFDGPSGPVTQDAQGYGAYVQTGVFWRLAGHLNLGLDLRYNKADVDLGDRFSVEAGGFHGGVLIGYGW